MTRRPSALVRAPSPRWSSSPCPGCAARRHRRARCAPTCAWGKRAARTQPTHARTGLPRRCGRGAPPCRSVTAGLPRAVPSARVGRPIGSGSPRAGQRPHDAVRLMTFRNHQWCGRASQSWCTRGGLPLVQAGARSASTPCPARGIPPSTPCPPLRPGASFLDQVRYLPTDTLVRVGPRPGRGGSGERHRSEFRPSRPLRCVSSTRQTLRCCGAGTGEGAPRMPAFRSAGARCRRARCARCGRRQPR